MLQHQMNSSIFCKNALAYFGGAKGNKEKKFYDLGSRSFQDMSEGKVSGVLNENEMLKVILKIFVP